MDGNKGGTPTWAIVFMAVSVLGEFLIELTSNYVEDWLGDGSVKLLVTCVVGAALIGGFLLLARRREQSE
jgi:hypothetical protein